MPRRSDVHHILVLGSGPIQIGQGCEFDYSGTQACRALRDEGFRVSLVNSNPATIMTDPETADAVFIEPLTVEEVEKIIAREKPDAILPTVGGQVSLNLFLELHARGILAAHGVRALGVTPETVHLTEDRRAFRELVVALGLGVVRGGLASSPEEARALANALGFPLVVRASFALGGTGGGMARNERELEALLARNATPDATLAIEESIAGWKEYELEIMRDEAGNFSIICGIENVNPMGVHTGDSITVAPPMTLTDVEYQTLRDQAKRLSAAVGMTTGGANIQFAVNPNDGRIVVIEMNPRVSRSSALVSKATGYPIARIAAKLAVGWLLPELSNDVTGTTLAAFEPAIDYVAVKIPRFDSEKFGATSQPLGVEMKSVGEVLAFGRTFKDAFLKAWRALEQGHTGVPHSELSLLNVEKYLREPTSDLLPNVKRALELQVPKEKIQALTGLGMWFLDQIEDIVEQERRLERGPVDARLVFEAKRSGFSNARIAELCCGSEAAIAAQVTESPLKPTFRMVDTCAGEFEARTPYFYKTYEDADENRRLEGESIVILGAGPNRIGQGIEFDYSCVHAIQAVKAAGRRAIVINSNPETVSTDASLSDKLFLEPVCLEDVLDVLRAENPAGVLVQFGGQTPLKLAAQIEAAGFKVLGSPQELIETVENRELFAKALSDLGLRAPPWRACWTTAEARAAAVSLGYPLIVRPSFVLGGRGMFLVRNEAELLARVDSALAISREHPLFVDRYLEGALEFDVDLVSDGRECLVPALMEHIEEAGIHSGDSTALIPPVHASAELRREILESSQKLALSLGVVGLLNIQFAAFEGTLYVLEANPRASRSLPFVAKATGVPLARLGALACLGLPLSEVVTPAWRATCEKASSMPNQTTCFAAKTPVFPFGRFPAFAPRTGPEMRSIGEVMTTAPTVAEALRKGLVAAGYRRSETGVVIVVCDEDQVDALAPAVRHAVYEGGRQVLAPGPVARALKRTTNADVVEMRTDDFVAACEPLFSQGKVALVVAPLGCVTHAVVQEQLCRLAVSGRVPFTNSVRAAEALGHALVQGMAKQRAAQ